MLGLLALGFGIILFIVVVAWVIGAIMSAKILGLFGTCSPLIGFVPFFSNYMVGKTCTGKDGKNFGVFGLSLPNWFWEFGWAMPLAVGFVLGVISGIVGEVAMLDKLGSAVISVCTFMWWSSIYTFVYSRTENRSEHDVCIISIVSAVIGLIGLIKVMCINTPRIYSQPNDIYPQSHQPKQDFEW